MLLYSNGNLNQDFIKSISSDKLEQRLNIIDGFLKSSKITQTDRLKLECQKKKLQDILDIQQLQQDEPKSKRARTTHFTSTDVTSTDLKTNLLIRSYIQFEKEKISKIEKKDSLTKKKLKDYQTLKLAEKVTLNDKIAKLIDEIASYNRLLKDMELKIIQRFPFLSFGFKQTIDRIKREIQQIPSDIPISTDLTVEHIRLIFDPKFRQYLIYSFMSNYSLKDYRKFLTELRNELFIKYKLFGLNYYSISDYIRGKQEFKDFFNTYQFLDIEKKNLKRMEDPSYEKNVFQSTIYPHFIRLLDNITI